MNKLQQMIRAIVQEEIAGLVDETSGTGAVAGFQTPYWGRSKDKNSPENPYTKDTEKMEGGKKKLHQPVPFGESKKKLAEDWGKKAKERAETVGNEIMTGDENDHDKNNSIDDRSKTKDFESPAEGTAIRKLEGKTKLPKAPAFDQDDAKEVSKKGKNVSTMGGYDFVQAGTEKAGRVQNSVPYRKGGPYWKHNISQVDGAVDSDQKKAEKEADDDEAAWAEETRAGNNTGFGRGHLGYASATNNKKMTKEFEETGEEIPKAQYVKSALHEGASRYHQFKADESTAPRAKIGKALSEMNRQLQEVERIVEMSRRLKVETNVGNGEMWKRANKALVKMENRLVSLSSKLKELRS